MVGRALGLVLLGGVGWWLTRQAAPDYQGALGTTGIPWSPNLWNLKGTTQPGDGEGIDWIKDWSIMTTEPRGIRNNNPGNLEDTGVNWQGLDDPRNDGRFMRFVSPEYGIRAMARVLDTYTNTHGLRTVGDIVNRWAPVHENPTTAYVKHVANALGVGPTQPIDVMARRPELIAAMIYFENGKQPYSLATINQGVAMA